MNDNDVMKNIISICMEEDEKVKKEIFIRLNKINSYLNKNTSKIANSWKEGNTKRSQFIEVMRPLKNDLIKESLSVLVANKSNPNNQVEFDKSSYADSLNKVNNILGKHRHTAIISIINAVIGIATFGTLHIASGVAMALGFRSSVAFFNGPTRSSENANKVVKELEKLDALQMR